MRCGFLLCSAVSNWGAADLEDRPVRCDTLADAGAGVATAGVAPPRARHLSPLGLNDSSSLLLLLRPRGGCARVLRREARVRLAGAAAGLDEDRVASRRAGPLRPVACMLFTWCRAARGLIGQDLYSVDH